MEYIRVSAKTVDDAIIEASIQLETSSDNIEYEVLETGSKGFLGIGSKPAVIRARRKMPSQEEILEDDIREIVKADISLTKPAKEPIKEKKEKKEKRPAATKQENEKAASPAAAVKKGKAPEPVPAAKQESGKAAAKQGAGKPQVSAAASKQESRQEESAPAKPAAAKAPINQEAAASAAKEFLEKLLNAMNLKNVEIKTSFDEEETLNIDLQGDDMGILIGKRGQTLDSVQYLTSLVVNKGQAGYVRVKVDTEDYRRRRKETLENLARNIALKVRRTKKTVFLEPMNPYERRIIHSALQNNPYVSTHSEGEEPYRKVVVTLKKQQ